jgi:WD40 repeat protein
VILTNTDNQAAVIVYEREPMSELHHKPALFSHEGSEDSSLMMLLEFTKLSFSADSDLVAGITTDPHLGILIYRWRTAEYYQTIPFVAVINDISFHPSDSSKIIVAGCDSLLKFWHFNNRYSNAAPVTVAGSGSLPERDYCSIVWINKTQVVVGSTDGMLTIVKGCDAKQTRRAFRPDEEFAVSVSKIIVKGDMLLACSISNRLALFELSKSTDSGVVDDVFITLTFRNRFILGSYVELKGISWSMKSEFSNTVLVASATELSVFDIDKFHEEETQALVLQPMTHIARYHSGTIRNIALSAKSGLFAASCIDDESVSVWDIGTEKSLDLVREKYYEGVGMPLSIDIHPTGRRVVFGCENYFREYAVTFHNLEMMSDFPSQAIFNGPKGEAFVNNSSVSKVKYSNNGVYLAIITGRL